MKPLRITLVLLATASLAAFVAAASAADRERGDRRRSKDSSSASATAPAAIPGAGVSPADSFDAFQLIVERNIFNPNRIGRTRAVTEEKPPRVDEISLVGTMRYSGGVTAFFDSPDTAFQKALHEGESVADFKVKSIAADGVELVRGDKPLTLKVAQQLRRAEGGDWNVVSIVPPLPPAEAGGVSRVEAVRPADPGAVAEAPAEMSDVLKKLMEKRKKQLQK